MTGNRLPEIKSQNLAAARDQALKAVTERKPLAKVLTDLILAVEANSEVEMLGSVLLMDETGEHLLTGAAPSLPKAYNDAIHGVEIGPAVGSCGTAAFYGEPVFVDDIKSDPLWVDFKDVALEHGLRACWSTPLKDGDGMVIGTFANYYRAPRHPRPEDVAAITFVADAAAAAILGYRALEPASA